MQFYPHRIVELKAIKTLPTRFEIARSEKNRTGFSFKIEQEKKPFQKFIDEMLLFSSLLSSIYTKAIANFKMNVCNFIVQQIRYTQSSCVKFYDFSD